MLYSLVQLFKCFRIIGERMDNYYFSFRVFVLYFALNFGTGIYLTNEINKSISRAANKIYYASDPIGVASHLLENPMLLIDLDFFLQFFISVYFVTSIASIGMWFFYVKFLYEVDCEGLYYPNLSRIILYIYFSTVFIALAILMVYLLPKYWHFCIFRDFGEAYFFEAPIFYNVSKFLTGYCSNSSLAFQIALTLGKLGYTDICIVTTPDYFVSKKAVIEYLISKY